LFTGARTGVVSGASTLGARDRPRARSQAANATAAAHHGVEACGHQGRGPCSRQGTWARRSRPPGRLSATAGRLDGAARGHRCTRAPVSGAGQPAVRAPVGGTPQLGSARSNTGTSCSSAMLSQLRDTRRTEEEEKVKLGFFLGQRRLIGFVPGWSVLRRRIGINGSDRADS